MSGPKIIIEAADGYKIVSGIGEVDDKIYVVVRIINRGDKPTTLDRIAIETYNNHIWFQKYVFRRKSKSYLVPNPITKQRLPFKLESGAIWDGSFLEVENQNHDIVTKVFGFCSHSKRSASTVVKKNLNRKKQELTNNSGVNQT